MPDGRCIFTNNVGSLNLVEFFKLNKGVEALRMGDEIFLVRARIVISLTEHLLQPLIDESSLPQELNVTFASSDVSEK